MKNNQKKNVVAYTCGYVFIYDAKFKTNEVGVQIKTRNLSDFEFVCKLKFNDRFKRQSDVSFAEAEGKSLDLKISTPLYRKVDSGMYAIIKDKIYSIYYLDPDEINREMYLYMEEFGDVEKD